MRRSTAHVWAVSAAIAAVVLTTAVGLLESRTAFAHADYERSEPGRNEVLAAAPEQVDVWFSQDVRKREGFYYVRVFDEQGVQISDGDGTVDDDDRTHIFAALPSDAGAGRYVVEWMTTSDLDGDSDEGAFCFYAGVEPTTEQQTECAVFDEDVRPTPTERSADPTADAGASPTLQASPTPLAPDNSGDDDSNTALTVAAVIIGAVVMVALATGVWFIRR